MILINCSIEGRQEEKLGIVDTLTLQKIYWNCPRLSSILSEIKNPFLEVGTKSKELLHIIKTRKFCETF